MFLIFVPAGTAMPRYRDTMSQLLAGNCEFGVVLGVAAQFDK